MTGRPRLTAATVLAALSVLLGVLAAVASITGWPSWEQPGMLVRALLTLAGQGLFAAAVTVLLRESRPAARRSPWIFAVTLLAALAALQVFVAAYSASFDAADAGVPATPVARLALPAIVMALAGFGVALAALTVAMRPTGARRGGIATAAGLLGAVPAAVLFLFPAQWVWLPVAALVGLGIRSVRLSPRRSATQAQGSVVAARARPARLLAGAALAIVVLSWGAGAWVGIATTGTETATTAMGLAAAGAQLAAVPLLLCVAGLLRDAGRGGAATTPPVLAVVAAGLAAGTLIAGFGHTPDGGALFLGSAISGASLGLWFAALVVPALPGPLLRVLVAIALVAAAEAAWFMLVAGVGGLVLGALALVLLLLARPAARLSPAPAPASP